MAVSKDEKSVKRASANDAPVDETPDMETPQDNKNGKVESTVVSTSESAADADATVETTTTTKTTETTVQTLTSSAEDNDSNGKINSDVLPPDLGTSTETRVSNTVKAQAISEPPAASTPSEKVDYKDFQLMPDSTWPPPVFIHRDVTPKERYYIEHRWNSQWAYFDQQAVNNKKRYYFWQLIVVLGSVTVPVLVGFDPTILNTFTRLSEPTARIVIDTLTVIISLAVAIAAGIEGLNSYGEQWSSNRQAAEDMQAEKAFYDMRVRYYDSKNSSEAFSKFVQRTEEIIAQQNGRFIQSVEQQLESSDTLNQDITSKYQKKFVGEESYTVRNPSESSNQTSMTTTSAG